MKVFPWAKSGNRHRKVWTGNEIKQVYDFVSKVYKFEKRPNATHMARFPIRWYSLITAAYHHQSL